jgi:putative transposase
MHRSYLYRIDPLPDQLSLLEVHRAELSSLWNHALAQRRDAWAKEHRAISYLDQQRDLTRWRNFDCDGLGRLSVAVAQDCLQRLDLSVRAFLRRRKAGRRPGFPRFRRTVDSFTFTPARDPLGRGPDATWRLKVPRIGEVPLRLHRPLPLEASVRTVTVRRDAGAWFAVLSLELPDPPLPPTSPPRNPVGVDLGVTHLVTLSNGESIKPGRFLADAERRLRRDQRRLARRHRGSHRYEQQREKVARRQAKVRRQRRWYAHQISRDLAERFDLVAFEDLDAAELIEGNRLAKGIGNAGWGMLRGMTEYKEAERSGRCVRVPTRGSSQSCSACGRVAEPRLTLRDRVYRCPCGYEGDRDVNAARNILARSWPLLSGELRRSTAEETRGENGPTRARGGRRVYQRRRAGSRNREHGIVVGAAFESPTWMVGLAVPIP